MRRDSDIAPACPSTASQSSGLLALPVYPLSAWRPHDTRSFIHTSVEIPFTFSSFLPGQIISFVYICMHFKSNKDQLTQVQDRFDI